MEHMEAMELVALHWPILLHSPVRNHLATCGCRDGFPSKSYPNISMVVLGHVGGLDHEQKLLQRFGMNLYEDTQSLYFDSEPCSVPQALPPCVCDCRILQHAARSTTWA
jgi:hypothetical protein